MAAGRCAPRLIRPVNAVPVAAAVVNRADAVVRRDDRMGLADRHLRFRRFVAKPLCLTEGVERFLRPVTLPNGAAASSCAVRS
jgi:hypothetical protein